MIKKQILENINHFLKKSKKENEQTNIIFSFHLRSDGQAGVILGGTHSFLKFTIVQLIKIYEKQKKDRCEDCGRIHN